MFKTGLLDLPSKCVLPAVAPFSENGDSILHSLLPASIPSVALALFSDLLSLCADPVGSTCCHTRAEAALGLPASCSTWPASRFGPHPRTGSSEHSVQGGLLRPMTVSAWRVWRVVGARVLRTLPWSPAPSTGLNSDPTPPWGYRCRLVAGSLAPLSSPVLAAPQGLSCVPRTHFEHIFVPGTAWDLQFCALPGQASQRL